MRRNEVCPHHLVKMMKRNNTLLLLSLLLIWKVFLSECYDPADNSLAKILPANGTFEAFYPQQAFGVDSGSSRASHGHGSFYKHRNPALIDVKNAPAYGFRFDGYRRFNFD
ncbi:UNVERIFIED_CONTAM: hypothetical protein PYX00_001232 [Menopon gallinae]|uniref:Uncharacterized protein n=1 Tax=Menopon gallinae TaxID=328185 RepID=A0AAW2IBZ1_9NEOP